MSGRSRALRPLLALTVLTFASVTGCLGAASSPTTSTPSPVAASDNGIGELAIVIDQRIVLRPPSGSDSVLVSITAPAVYPAFPAWSPDGSQLAYVEKRFPTGGGPNEDWGDDIVIASPDGGSPRVVHRHGAPSWQVNGLAWTSDSSALVFGDVRPVIQDGRFAGSTARLTRLELATGAERELVNGAYSPSFSRDGKRLAYLSAAGGLDAGGLMVADADGANAQTVVAASKFPTLLFPRLSPDGTSIAFAAFPGIAARPTSNPARTVVSAILEAFLPTRAYAHGIPMDVWRAEVSTGAITRLTVLYEDDPYPTWSADGREVIAIGLRGLYRIALDGSSVRNVGTGAFGAHIDLRPRK